MMEKKGLVKLMEECGEVIQVAAKKCAYMDVEIHPDGSDMKERLIEELGDLKAAMMFVEAKLMLDTCKIDDRALMKLKRFNEWDKKDE